MREFFKPRLQELVTQPIAIRKMRNNKKIRGKRPTTQWLSRKWPG